MFCGMTQPARVFVTGAAGRIGSWFAAHAAEEPGGRFALTLMTDPDHPDNPADDTDDTDDTRNDAPDLASLGRVVEARLEDLDTLTGLFAGHDALLHLAADPSPDAGWQSLLPNNIVGTYNAFEAARRAGVKHVVYASSIHAVSGYPVDHQVREPDAPLPGDLYGASKAFAEGLAGYYAVAHGMSLVGVRIGAFQPLAKAAEPEAVRLLDSFVSRRDLCDLLVRCLHAGPAGHRVVHGISDNRYKRLDVRRTRELTGYAPQDDVAEQNPDLHAAGVDRRMDHRGT